MKFKAKLRIKQKEKEIQEAKNITLLSAKCLKKRTLIV
jgi:hypothetical protein